MGQNWNAQFTSLLRGTRPSLWGNWTLDANIAPGAVGTIDVGTGAFEWLTTLPGARVTATNSVSNDWKISSDSVTENTSNVNFNGSVTDPETGEKITAGVDVQWSFANKNSVSSTFTLLNQASLSDCANQINNNLPWLKQRASSVNMLTNNTIVQGFGVITSVLYASCGLNLGSLSDKSSFSISGSADAVNAMAGNSEVGAKGSYVSTTETSAFESHLWPSESGSLATSPVAIAFEFTSFVDGQLLQGWISNLSAITITLFNDHGGTYIVEAVASYTLNGASESITKKVSGGLVAVMDPIPVGATDLTLDLSFQGIVSSDHHQFVWQSPVAQFPGGQILIDLYGVWPGSTTATERTTGESG